MEIVTYTLKPDQRNSEVYYSDVRAFTKDVLFKADYSIMPIVSEFTDYLCLY